jgi:hypothetical protein
MKEIYGEFPGYQGLYRFNAETGWTVYNLRNSGLPDAFSAPLVVDGNGQVWFGSYSAGLARLDPAEALPAQYIPLLGGLGTIVIPAGLLAILAAAAGAIFLIQRGRNASMKQPDLPKIMTGAFGAAIGGLYALGQHELFANQMMKALLGENWSHGDFFAIIGTPLLSICLVPLAGIIGAAMGVFVGRLLLQVFHRDQMISL